MKIQDIVFIIVFMVLLSQKKFEWLAALGLACIVLSIPLFSLWIFFTAEDLLGTRHSVLQYPQFIYSFSQAQ